MEACTQVHKYGDARRRMLNTACPLFHNSQHTMVWPYMALSTFVFTLARLEASMINQNVDRVSFDGFII